MASKKQTKKGGQSNAVIAAEVGAGIAALAAAGAGYYFYGDKDAKKHRVAATKWAKGMKDDVVKEAKKLKKIDQKAISGLVDKASAAYEGVRNVDKSDLTAASRELKKHWKSVADEIKNMQNKVKSAGSATKKVGSTAKKAAKKSAGSAKKAVKKTVKKATSRSR